MAQNPIPSFVAQNPAKVASPLKVTGAGALLQSAGGLGYQDVAASQSAKALGTGAVGDVLNSLVIVPLSSAAGAVSIVDGTGGSAVTVELFAGGGTTALADLRPQVIALNMVSVVGGWHVTTGANVQALAIGQFTP